MKIWILKKILLRESKMLKRKIKKTQMGKKIRLMLKIMKILLKIMAINNKVMMRMKTKMKKEIISMHGGIKKIGFINKIKTKFFSLFIFIFIKGIFYMKSDSDLEDEEE